MFEYSTSWYILAVGLLSLISKTNLTAHDNNHGYISSNERYFDDFSFIEREISSTLRSDHAGDNIKFQIKFDPATLDFRQRPLGVPHIKQVHLFNFDTNRSIDMTSISGSTVHFHSSFFHDKKIPPLGNTSFNVVFLGREEGFVESCLYIHTNNGHFKYNVKGVSIYSPYYLRPIVDIRLPMNASFGPLIYIHNPHAEPIQILEVYSSGGDFHLELPSGELEGPKDIWEIAPFETKAVIRVKFTARSEQNHTAFVRIKLNSTEEALVVPLEVEVGPKGGIFSPQGYVDFGIGGSMDAPKRVKLCLLNPFVKPVKIQSINTSSKSIKIDYEPYVVIPNGKTKGGCTNIANLTIDWRKAFKHQDYTGKIQVKYRNGKSSAEIPYFLTVLEGGVTFDAHVTKYFVNDRSKSMMRQFKLKNEFKSTIRILNLTMGDELRKYFKIDNFKPTVLKEQEEAAIFSIDLKPGVKLENLNINSHIRLVTNISHVAIPVLTYKGTLKLYLPFKSKDYSLDVGLISFNTKKEIHFLIHNDNPVSINIKGLKTSIPLTSTTILGCGKNDPRFALLHHTFENLFACSQLKPGEYAILKLVVQTANNEGHVWGEIQIETDFENLSIPVQFKVASGKLEIGPDRLVFDQCFPGKICSHPLRVHSTFNEPMIIKNIISLPPDARLTSRHSGHILAHTTKIVGYLYLNPNIGCKNECYTGFHQDIFDLWLKTFTLPKSLVNFDLNLFNTFYNRFLNVTSNGLRRWQNLTLRLDTSEVRSHMFRTRVKMSWPSLLQDDNVDNKSSTVWFPLTQIGNISYRNITLKNPSSHNLIVQVLFDRSYPHVEILYEGLPSTNLPPYVSLSNLDNFFFAKKGAQHQHKKMDNVKWHPATTLIMLKPGENYTLSIGFRGDKIGEFSTLLFLRNNLTVMEVLRLQGKCSEPIFRLGNRKSGAAQPLLFEFNEKYAKECEREKDTQQRKLQNENIAVRRSFTARNLGEIPVHVKLFYVNDAICEGYGFKVLNCAPFTLPANGSRKIDIEFSPDFTLAKVVRKLTLKTSCNYDVNYTLQATVPSYYISLCSNTIPRPQWEWFLGFIATTSMSVVVTFILIVAIFDAERIKRQMMDAILSCNPTTQPVLDLRLLGQQVREEVQNARTEQAQESQKVEAELRNQTSEEIYVNRAPEKQSPVLIPAVGKSRRKLGKRNSNETTAATATSNGELEVPVRTCKHHNKTNNSMERKDKEDERKSSHYNINNSNKENNKKVINCNKRLNSNNSNSNKLSVEEEMMMSENIGTNSTTTNTNEDLLLESKEKCSMLMMMRLNGQHSRKTNKNENSVSATAPVTTPTEEKEIKTLHHHHHHHHAKLERRRSTKGASKTKELENNKNQTNVTGNNGKNETTQKKKQQQQQHGASSNNNINKEHNKVLCSRKMSLEKQQLQLQPNVNVKTNNSSNVISDYYCQSSTATSSSSSSSVPIKAWSETRASFSDVVSRNDPVTTSTLNNVNNNARTSCNNSNKPTMYVEPYNKQQMAVGSTAQTLGPIGSKPCADNMWQHGNGDDSSSGGRNGNAGGEQRHLHNNGGGGSRFCQNESVNSFFSSMRCGAIDVAPILTDTSEWEGIGGPQQQQQMHQRQQQQIQQETEKLFQYDPLRGTSPNPISSRQGDYNILDPWNHNLLNSSSYWGSTGGGDNGNISLSNLGNNGSSAIVGSGPISRPAQTQQQQQQSSTRQNSYVSWDSSSMWQSWVPLDVPRTPTRTPPGFAAIQPNNSNMPEQDSQQQQRTESYNPFTSNNLWNQQQNIWKYSKDL